MDDKSLQILEYPKILERLASHCAFPASAEKARALRPTNDLETARRLQAETSEALRLIDHTDLTIGGARDVRQPVDLALHGGVLAPNELLDVKYTLVAARNLARTFERIGSAYPRLTQMIAQLPPPLGIIDAITRAISDHGEILDSASQKLATIRRDLRVVHDRLLSKLQKMVTDPKNAPYLQEPLVTLRDGRYVLPLRAEFKGRIKAIVHDQSASGATLFIEPFSTVEQNNQYRELQLAERDEERRILAELSTQVAEHADEITGAVDIIAEFDLALARAKYSAALRASEPALVEISDSKPIPTLRLFQARHPLLDPSTVVPIDVELEAQTFALVITGPNTGGKTVALKTVGILSLMAQSGLHIPAQAGSEISLFRGIYADIGDEQSIEQSLSTFSSHVTNIIRILGVADSRCLVILDELGAGTDPQEGAALARAILTHLVERRVTTLVTTHHPELKAFAHATPGVTNASVEFDLETLRPTFRLTIGLPGRSNALAIAQRLGMPDAIIQAARGELHPDDLRAEDLLDEIHRQRNLAGQARAEAEKARQEAQTLRNQLAERLEKIEAERRQVLEEARLQAQEEVEALRLEIAQIRRRLLRQGQPAEEIKDLQEKVEALEEQLERPIEFQPPEADLPVVTPEARRPIRLGDRVRLRSLGTQGVVIALSPEEAELQVGVMRLRARLPELQLIQPQAVEKPGRRQAISPTRPEVETKSPEAALPSETSGGLTLPAAPESPGLELDLRGKRLDEAQDALERYLESAFVARMLWARIIHGKGTGRLRQMVRQVVQNHPHVRSFEPGGEKEGGDGVTVVKFAES